MPIDGLVKAVNLIPSEHRVAAKPVADQSAGPSVGGSPTGAYVILAALALAIVAAALYVLTTNSIKENQAELAQVEQQAAVVEQQATALQSFADFKQLSQSRVDTVSALAGARFDWAQTLDDVSRALPSDVFVNSLDGSTTSAAGGSSLRGAISAPSIELTGCTKDQTSVARLMSSLRDVRGVTRVSLAKSEAVDSTTTAVAPVAPTTEGEDAPTVTTEPCPAGSPPTFDMVIFFERAAVSANASPNPAAGITGVSSGPTGPTGAAGVATTSPTTPTSTTP